MLFLFWETIQQQSLIAAGKLPASVTPKTALATINPVTPYPCMSNRSDAPK